MSEDLGSASTAQGATGSWNEATEVTPSLMVGATVGDYKIEAVIGRGGMGTVYGGVNVHIGKRAAIKVLNPELCTNPEVIDRFMTEARAVNQIGHPNIVDIFGFGTMPDGQHYMVMEWLRGEPLTARLRRPTSLVEACDILEAVSSALEAAHEQQIVHRDLKPDNIFMAAARSGPASVKLLDFGIAKLMTLDDAVAKTKTGMMMGTPAYLSPEQARGKGVDHRSDIYSLGVIAFEMFAGVPPFVSETAMDMIVAHMHTDPPAPTTIKPELPPAVNALVLAMMAKQVAERPNLATVRAALAELKAGAHELTVLPPRQGTANPVQPAMPVALAQTYAGAPMTAARPPVHTTLRGASGQIDAVAPPKRSRMWMALGGVVLAGGAIAAVVVATGGSRDNQPTPAASAAPAPAPTEPTPAPTPVAPTPVAPPTPAVATPAVTPSVVAPAVDPPTSTKVPKTTRVLRPTSKLSSGTTVTQPTPASTPDPTPTPTPPKTVTPVDTDGTATPTFLKKKPTKD